MNVTIIARQWLKNLRTIPFLVGFWWFFGIFADILINDELD